MKSKKMFMAVTLICLIAVFGLAGCSEDDPVLPGSSGLSPARTLGMAAPVEEEGKIGPGSVYRIYVPEDWNGDLVLYAHGFKDLAAPVVPPTGDNWPLLRDALLELDYAIAYSSFSENGLAIKDGAQRTHQLRGVFADKYGEPDLTYVIGHSLGGAIAVELVEKHPEHYAGALPMCGMIGGSKAQVDFVGNVRVLFDFCYPDVLPGSVCDVPDDYDLNDVIASVIGAISESPECAFAITQIDQTPVPFTTPEQLVESFVRAIGFNFRGFEDLMGRTHGRCPFDNRHTVYTGAVPQQFLGAVNALVERYERTPDADNYLSHYFEPTGDLEIPMLTLHTAWDPVVPIFHEGLYQQAVAGAGKSDLLVQRTVMNYGHCKFGATDEAGAVVMVQAFEDLVNWVENGVKPTP